MATSSRDNILNRLRAARDPFPDLPETPLRKPVTNLKDTTPAALRARFIEEAIAVKCNIHEADSDSDALEMMMGLLNGDLSVMMWDPQHIPVHGLSDALAEANVTPAPLRDNSVRVGITGADAALAATGSVVVISGPGKTREASLLPLVHIAVLKADRILPDIETFYAMQSTAELTANSNIAVISGPSKSADIAQTLIHGMHGPGQVHIVIVP